jgi:methionyl-tRNA formyltransferase
MPPEGQESWRVVLFTDFPQGAAWYKQFLPAKGHRLVAVVTSSKRQFPYLDVVRGAQPEVDVLVSNHPRRWAEMLRPLRPDLVVATVFPWRIPDDVLALPRLGAVNVHPALLPRYRGAMTPFWLLRNGEREGGVTLHRMTADFDAGSILAQERFAIDDDDDIPALFQKVGRTFAPLWEAALPRIARGDPGEPQDEAQASYFGQIEDEAAWRAIDWTRPAREIHNQVRSCGWAGAQPAGAVGTIDGAPTRITRTRLVDAPSDGADPGTVVSRTGDALLVQCGDRPLEIVEHQPA